MRPESIPVPDEEDELAVEDVFIVDGGTNDLPDGWAVMDGDLVLDEVWLTREVTAKKLSVSQRLEMINAKKAEMQSYFANKVWEFEDPKPGDSMRTISARWVLTFKEDPPGSTPRAKARLVLRGFQDPDMGSIETSSPTAARQAKFVLLALAPVMSWTLYAGDVKTAFLSGSTFSRRILVRLPADCRPLLGETGDGPTFMRMLKSAYGLADAPLLWHREATRRLLSVHWVASPLDRCRFCYYSVAGTLIGCLVLHVDDLLVAGNRAHKEFQEAIRVLKRTFLFGKWEELTKDHALIYCGGKIQMVDGGLTLDYHDYMRKVHPVTIPKGKDMAKKLTASDVSRARGILGALQWPAVQGIPSLAATSSILAAEINTGSGQLLTDLNKALRFGKSAAEVKLQMTKVTDSIDNLCFLAFSDAAFGCAS